MKCRGCGAKEWIRTGSKTRKCSYCGREARVKVDQGHGLLSLNSDINSLREQFDKVKFDRDYIPLSLNDRVLSMGAALYK